MEVLIANDSFAVYCETHEEDVYLHLEVFKWSVSVYKRLLVVFEDIKQEFKGLGYARIRSVSPKGKESKLTNMCGLTPILETDVLYINEVKL